MMYFGNKNIKAEYEIAGEDIGRVTWGSPVGAVGSVLRAVNEVKLAWARIQLEWVTRLTVSIGLWLWADQLRP